MTLRTGDRAPHFTAVDDMGNRFELRDLRGRASVIHFFVLAWTGV